MERATRVLGLMVLAQAAHSVEEYSGRLWETFPPARILTGLVASDLERGFIVINVSLVGLGLICFLVGLLRGFRAVSGFAWFWVVIGGVNGVGHPLWSLRMGTYTPGLLTAPVLLVLAIALAWQTRRNTHESPAA